MNRRRFLLLGPAALSVPMAALAASRPCVRELQPGQDFHRVAEENSRTVTVRLEGKRFSRFDVRKMCEASRELFERGRVLP